jgi:hypothetical protein
MIAMDFIASNSKEGFCISEVEYQKLILDVAQGAVTKKEIAAFFRSNCLK